MAALVVVVARGSLRKDAKECDHRVAEGNRAGGNIRRPQVSSGSEQPRSVRGRAREGIAEVEFVVSDESQVCTESERVRVFRPVHVIYKIVNRNDASKTSGEVLQRREIAKGDRRLHRRAVRLEPLTRVSPPEGIREIGLEKRRVAQGETFAVLKIDEARRLTGEVLIPVAVVVLQIAAQEESVLAVPRKVVIHPRNVGIPPQFDSGREAEAPDVHAVSQLITVGQRVLLEER